MESSNRRIAIVTGVGRRQGIGYAVCETLSKTGFDIFYTYFKKYDSETGLIGSEENPQNFVVDFEKNGSRSACIEIDLRERNAQEKLFTEVIQTLGSPSVLINNACVSTNQSFLDVTADILDEHYFVNVRATTLLCLEFIKRCNSGGSIINLTSGQSLGVMEGELPYTITKASVDMLTIQLAPELLKRGITINAVDPGPTDTGWMSGELKEQIIESSPKGKITLPEEVAEAIFSFIGGENKSVTSTIFHVPR